MAIKQEDLLAAARRDPKTMLGEGPPLGEEDLGESPDAYIDGVDHEEIAELDDLAEEGVATCRTLQGITDAVEETLQTPEGGLSEPVATALSVAVEAFTKDLGFAPKVFPNLHHFSRPELRAGATQMVMEDLKQTIARIGDTIVAVLQKILDALRAIVKAMLGAFKDTTNRARQIKQMAAEMTWGGDVDLAPPAFAKALFVKGALPDGGNLVAAYKEHIKLMDEIMRDEEALSRLGCTTAKDCLEIAQDGEAVEMKLIEATVSYMHSLPGKLNNALSNAEVKVHEVPLVFGDRTYYASADAAFEGRAIAKHYKRELKMTHGLETQGELPTTVDALTQKEVQALAEAMMQSNALMSSIEKINSDLNSTMSALRQRSKQLKTSFSQGASANKSGAEIYGFIQGCLRVVYSGTRELVTYDDRVSKYITKYCIASMQAHSQAAGDTGTDK